MNCLASTATADTAAASTKLAASDAVPIVELVRVKVKGLEYW